MSNSLRMSSWARARPLLAIVGPTGTGKSQLAVHIAKQFKGEIINADALQMYQGLPIATNKLSEIEMQGIPHHLLGFISISEPAWDVTKFVNKADDIIADVHERGRLPIVVGGTHYYILSLLYKDRLLQHGEYGSSSEHFWPVLDGPTEEMTKELHKIDPVAASWWHPKEHRKIRRSLEICLQTGRKVSEIYQEQTKIHTDEDQMRYDALCLYLHADRSKLNERLDIRVDRMISSGLLQEAEFMRDERRRLIEQGIPIDDSKGIWVAIGFKEFLKYFDDLADDDSSKKAAQTEANARERMRISTRQYAVKQSRFSKNKLLPMFQRSSRLAFYQILDASEIDHWQERVAGHGERLTRSYLANESMPDSLCI